MTDLKQLLSPEKFIPFYRDRKNLAPLQLAPVAVELHWTSDCNYDCVHCSYGSRRQTRGALSPEIINTVIDELITMKTQAVYLSGGGEPTVVKGWNNHARKLMDAGIEVALISNGVALLASQAQTLSAMNYVAVSVYSTDRNEYNLITKSRFFEKQWTCPALIKSAGGHAVVGARCVINKINYKNIVAIYLQAIASGYDYIIFIPAVDYEGRGISLGKQEQLEIKQLLSENNSIFDSALTNIASIVNRDINHYQPANYTEDFYRIEAGCAALTIRANAFINYCGGVWLCQPHIGNPLYQIGNVNDNKFSELWNAPRHQEVIHLLSQAFSAGQCKNCRSISFNKIADTFEHTPSDTTINDPFL